MLEIIHNNHRNINQLLMILRKKIKLLNNDEDINYHLIKTIISYLRNYADNYHHPLEDLIYTYYFKYSAVPAEIDRRLSLDHKLIKKVTNELNELIEMVLLDAIVPQQKLIERLSEFVETQSMHLNYKESKILPAISKSLSEDDWTNLLQQWKQKNYQDPLFGDLVSEEYSVLAERLNNA